MLRFKMDSPLMDFFNTTASFIALNFVFLLCCLPVVTIGPALAALYQVTMREARGEHSYLVKRFLVHFKEMLIQGVVTFLLFAVLAFVFVYSIAFWQQMDSALSSAVVALGYVGLFLVSIGFIYVFPLMARFQNTWSRTIKNAFFIALSNIRMTFALLIIHVFAIALVYLFPVSKVFLLFLGFAFVAYCCSFLLNKIFALYEPEVQEAAKETNPQVPMGKMEAGFELSLNYPGSEQ